MIGVGGVFSGEDAYKKICIGASIVQLYTAFAFKGPLVFSEILEDLNTLVKKDGIVIYPKLLVQKIINF